MEKVTQIYYDRENDVLYLSMGDPRPAISREMGDDVLLRVDPETDEVVGLTIFNLASRFGASDDPQRLPVTLDWQALTGQR